MAELRGRNELEGHISHLPGVGAALRKEANRIEGIADRKLTAVRAATIWTRFEDGGETRITVNSTTGKYTQDYWVTMEAPNAWAFEYGHSPSGKLAGTATDAPRGSYLMTMTYVQA